MTFLMPGYTNKVLENQKYQEYLESAIETLFVNYIVQTNGKDSNVLNPCKRPCLSENAVCFFHLCIIFLVIHRATVNSCQKFRKYHNAARFPNAIFSTFPSPLFSFQKLFLLFSIIYSVTQCTTNREIRSFFHFIFLTIFI